MDIQAAMRVAFTEMVNEAGISHAVFWDHDGKPCNADGESLMELWSAYQLGAIWAGRLAQSRISEVFFGI